MMKKRGFHVFTMALSITPTSRFADGHHASLYKKYRLKPHPKIMEHIMEYLAEKNKNVALTLAIDAACGSGQSTEMLSPHFRDVIGIDISTAQIAEAQKSNTLKNVSYNVADAVNIPVSDNSVDLVTCSQAAHWLDFPLFCKEADRILKPNGCLATVFSRPEMILYRDKAMTEKLTNLLQNLLFKDLRPYWDKHHYSFHYKVQDYEIPYPEFQRKCFEVEQEILYSTFLGFLRSFSTYRQSLKENPGSDILEPFQRGFARALGVDKPPSETMLILKSEVILLLGRKPCQE